MSEPAMRITVIIACHNRLPKTRECVEAVTRSAKASGVELSFVVVDDGCTDGTTEYLDAAVAGRGTVLRGNGALYWAGAMRLAVGVAATTEFEYLFLLNDDTALYEDGVESLLEHARTDAIVVGTVADPASGAITYGGWLQRHHWRRLKLTRAPQMSGSLVDTFNANAMLVGREAFRRLGNLSDGYTHSMADIDYGLRAKERGVAAMLASRVVGTCSNNGAQPKWQNPSLTPRQRIALLRSPLGLPLAEWARFSFRHGGLLAPYYAVSPLYRALVAGRGRSVPTS